MSGTRDRWDHLRIPYDKIEFLKELEHQGYGTVYKGKFDDQLVALKKLNITNLAHIKHELLDEILTISRFSQHPNLVALLGFCDEKSDKLILVYEYVAGGSLGGTRLEGLNTIQRLELCLGAARGLCYLHTGLDDATIVHGNITFSKILLNLDINSSKLEAKVSSFGLSKMMPGKAHKSLEYSYGVAKERRKESVVCSFGMLLLELLCGSRNVRDTDEAYQIYPVSEMVPKNRTKESDVCSFGVLLLELLCGSRNVPDTDEAYQIYLVSELVPKKMKQNKLRQIVDIHIRDKIEMEALKTYAEIACQCVMENPDDRPGMVKVVEELEKALILQGGEVTHGQISGSRNIPSIEKNVKDLIAVDKLDDVGEAILVDHNISTIEENVDVMIALNKLDDGQEAKVENENENIPSTKEEDARGLIMPDTLHDIGEAKLDDTHMIALIWSRVSLLKKAAKDWINKDSVIGIGITATAIGLIVGGIAVGLILIRN